MIGLTIKWIFKIIFWGGLYFGSPFIIIGGLLHLCDGISYLYDHYGMWPSEIWLERDRKLGIRDLKYHLSNHEGWRREGWPWDMISFQRFWYCTPISYDDYRYRADIISGWVASRDAWHHPEEYKMTPIYLDNYHLRLFNFWKTWYSLFRT